MKKLLLTIVSFFFLANVLFAQTNEDLLIEEIVSQVDTEELRLIVEQLSGATPLDDGSLILTRRVGTDGNEKAANYIAEQYSNIGNLVIRFDKFNPIFIGQLEKLLMKLIVAPSLEEEIAEQLINSLDYGIDFLKTNNIRKCENILAILRGENRQFVFTTAHYDSIVLEVDILNLATLEIIEDALAPGADDNATGVAATIIAARILSQYRLKNSICFMNPDVEELMMFGSVSYVLQHMFGLNMVKSVINVDMIGYDHDADGLLNVAYGEDSMKDVVSKEHNRLGLKINPVFLSIDALTESEFPIASDHFSFYIFGGVNRAVGFSEAFWTTETELDFNEGNLAGHTEEETVENINFDYMTEIVKLYIATLAREAGIIGRR
jgi:hypothetical protein